MSVVADTSAFIAIFLNEPDAERFRNAMLNEDKVFISAATGVELHLVVTVKLGAEGLLRLNHLLAEPLFEIVPVDRPQMVMAAQAYERFGKGRHPAGLNYGDLFSYALAKSKGLPLLFKGDDFSKTDLSS